MSHDQPSRKVLTGVIEILASTAKQLGLGDGSAAVYIDLIRDPESPRLAYVHALLRAWVAHEREIPIPFYGAALEQQYNSPTNQLIPPPKPRTPYHDDQLA